jgi:hypothetical protein
MFVGIYPRCGELVHRFSVCPLGFGLVGVDGESSWSLSSRALAPNPERGEMIVYEINIEST